MRNIFTFNLPVTLTLIQYAPKFNHLEPGSSPHAATKFHPNRFATFRVLLLTDRQTNRQTDAGENMTSLTEVINALVHVYIALAELHYCKTVKDKLV